MGTCGRTPGPEVGEKRKVLLEVEVAGISSTTRKGVVAGMTVLEGGRGVVGRVLTRKGGRLVVVTMGRRLEDGRPLGGMKVVVGTWKGKVVVVTGGEGVVVEKTKGIFVLGTMGLGE